MGQQVVILGGGVGGIVAATVLRRRLSPEHRVVLVDRRGEFVFAPSLLWVMVGGRRPTQVVRDLRSLVPRGVEVVRAEVEEIDPERGEVRAGEHTIPYDHLVVALGADLAPEALPGCEGVGHNFYDLDGAVGLGSALQRFKGGRVIVLVSALPFKCPAAPYEAAMLLEDALRRLGVRGRSRVEVFTPEPQPMPVAGPAIGRALVEMLEGKGILFHPSRQVERVDPEARELVFADGGREPFDLLAVVPPHRPPRAVRESPLAGPAGWIPVDKRTLSTRYENVYAIGDVTAITLPNGKLLPKAGVFAHFQAEAVAARVAARVEGKPPVAEFAGVGYCWVEMGGGVAAFAGGHFYAEPEPVVPPPRRGRLWHLGKVLFEHSWLGRGPTRLLARLGLLLGARALRIPVSL